MTYCFPQGPLRIPVPTCPTISRVDVIRYVLGR